MAIWTPEIKELEKLYESLRGNFPELEKELEQLIKFDDPNVIMLYSRRCLEVIITDLCESELKRPRKTEPLKGIIDKLHKEEKVSSHIITSMHGLNDLSTYGAHPKDFDPEQVKPVLNNLNIIIKWYLKFKRIDINPKAEKRENMLQLWTSYIERINKKERFKVPDRTGKSAKNKRISFIFLTIFMIIAVVLFYSRFFKQESTMNSSSSGGKISLAILPFQNMTNDIKWDRWEIGIQDVLVSFFSGFDNFKVDQKEAINSLLPDKDQNSIELLTPTHINYISKKTGANILISGSFNQSSVTLRINAQLVNAHSGEVINSFQIDENSEEIFPAIDSLANLMKEFLLISELKYELPINFVVLANTKSPKAYNYFIRGLNAFYKSDYPSAINFYLLAIEIDPEFTLASLQISFAYRALKMYDNAKKYCLMAYEKRDFMSIQLRIWTNFVYAYNFETPIDVIKNLEQLQEFDNQLYYYDIGVNYNDLHQYEKAIQEFEKWFEMQKKFRTKPRWVDEYLSYGIACHEVGQYRLEKRLYKRAEKDFPDDTSLISRQIILALNENDSVLANRYILKYKNIRTINGDSEATVLTGLADIFEKAKIYSQAEQYYREVLALQPENPSRKNNLANFIVDKDINVNEGLELADNILLSDSINFYALHCKGWALYKLNRYEEALKYLEKSWKVRPVYNHGLFLHLEAAKKAVAHQKSN